MPNEWTEDIIPILDESKFGEPIEEIVCANGGKIVFRDRINSNHLGPGFTEESDE